MNMPNKTWMRRVPSPYEVYNAAKIDAILADRDQSVLSLKATITDLESRLKRWQKGYNRIGTNHTLNEKDATIEKQKDLLVKSKRAFLDLRNNKRHFDMYHEIRDHLNEKVPLE